MRIVFFGEDSFSAIVLNSLAKANFNVVAVFCPEYDNLAHIRLKKLCETLKISFHRVNGINSKEVEHLIVKYEPDLISVNHFQKLLRKNIIDIPRLGCINLHPSLLPNYRGLSPIQQPIIHGETKTGVTVHYIDENIDTGDIIIQHEIPLTADMYVFDLQKELFKLYETIVIQAIEKIRDDSVPIVSQKNLPGSFFGKLKLSQCKIDLEKSVIDAMNLVRGVSRPYYGARHNDYCIWSGRLANTEENKIINNNHNANGIYFSDIFGVFIKFKDGSLIVKKYNKVNK